MIAQLRELDAFFSKYLGVGLRFVVLGPLLLALAGAALGVFFPKFHATALLQFPEPQKGVERVPTDPRLPEQRPFDPKANVIDLAAYKRVAASYDSAEQLGAYLRATGLAGRPAAERLLRQAAQANFWGSVATPILPFSRRDQREFGDIKDASATTILGLELTADAPTGAVAQEMVSILAGYYINAVVRERIRAWTLAGKLSAQSQEKGVQADILRAELDIDLYGRRAQDMKAILARYPDAVRLDSRQIISVNPAESGERYLSPLAQLVGAESAISQRREMIRRWQRELKQKAILAQFYTNADVLLDGEIDVNRLLAELYTLANKTLSHAEAAQEWNQEAVLRVNGALDNFEVMRTQFGVRNGIRVDAVASRGPLRLAGVGIAIGLALLAALAFLRSTFRTVRSEGGPQRRASDQPH